MEQETCKAWSCASVGITTEEPIEMQTTGLHPGPPASASLRWGEIEGVQGRMPQGILISQYKIWGPQV